MEDDSSERILKHSLSIKIVRDSSEVEDDSSERILKQHDAVSANGDRVEVEDDSSERILKRKHIEDEMQKCYRSGRRFFRENTETIHPASRESRRKEVEDDSSERILKLSRGVWCVWEE